MTAERQGPAPVDTGGHVPGRVPAEPLPPWLDLVPRSRNPLRLAAPTLERALGAPLPDTRTGLPSGPPSASVVIVTYNNQALTRLCLASLLGNTDGPDYEVIVVDNASTDGTR